MPLFPKWEWRRVPPNPLVENVHTALIVVKGIANDTQCPGLGTAAVLACTILEISERVCILKTNCRGLASRCLELIRSVNDVSNGGNSAPTLREDIETLTSILETIVQCMNDLVKLTWWQRFWNLGELEGLFQSKIEQLDDSITDFHLRISIRVHNRVTNIEQRVNKTADVLSSLDRNVEMVLITRTENNEVLNCGRREERCTTDQTNNHDFSEVKEYKLGEDVESYDQRFDWGDDRAEISKASLKQNGVQTRLEVIMRRYPRIMPRNSDVFKRDLEAYIELSRANLIQVCGRSSLTAQNPFILLFSYSNQIDVKQHLSIELSHGQEVNSFMTGLKLMKGFASALEYLRSCVSTADLKKCAELRDFRLKHGQIIIGNNLIDDAPVLEHVAENEDMERWLRDKSWPTAVEMLFEKPDGFDLSNWDSISGNGKRRCLRPLLTFVTYQSKNLRTISERLNTLWRILTEKTGNLTYPDIRKAMLEIEEVNHDFVYRPRKPLCCSAGQVGYIRDGQFIMLLELVTDLPCMDEGYSVSYGLFPRDKYTTTKLDDGIEKHTFDGEYANIRRHSSCTFLPKKFKRGLWQRMIDTAGDIIHEFGNPHNITASDLILITGVENDLRYTHAGWKSNDKPTGPIEFVEYTNPAIDKEWGYWENEDELDTSWQRCAQNIVFFQLEPGEI